jgi:hypothetical protein
VVLEESRDERAAPLGGIVALGALSAVRTLPGRT